MFVCIIYKKSAKLIKRKTYKREFNHLIMNKKLKELKTDLVYIISIIEEFSDSAIIRGPEPGSKSDTFDLVTGTSAERARAILRSRAEEIRLMTPDQFNHGSFGEQVDNKSELTILHWAYQMATKKYLPK